MTELTRRRQKRTGSGEIRRFRPLGLRGHAVVEVALMTPWLFFLFAGVLDFGFYAYAAISVQNAARVAALYAATTSQYSATSSSSSVDAVGTCFQAVEEMRMLPNVASGTTCSCAGTTCTAGPATIQVADLSAANCPVSGYACVRTTIAYTSVPMIPIPGLMGQMSISRIATVAVRTD